VFELREREREGERKTERERERERERRGGGELVKSQGLPWEREVLLTIKK